MLIRVYLFFLYINMIWDFHALENEKKTQHSSKDCWVQRRKYQVNPLIIFVAFHKWETKPLTEIYFYSKNNDSGFCILVSECSPYPEDL